MDKSGVPVRLVLIRSHLVNNRVADDRLNSAEKFSVETACVVECDDVEVVNVLDCCCSVPVAVITDVIFFAAQGRLALSTRHRDNINDAVTGVRK